MSTPTFTEPTASTPEAPSHIPVALWKAYRWQRGRNERPHIAASIALDQLHYTSQRSREPLTAMLTERERERGLGSTEAEQDEERALESAELEAGGAVVPMEPEQGSAEAVRRDAVRTVSELEAKRVALAPEALTNLDTRAEVERIDGEIRQARSLARLADDAESQTALLAKEEAERAAQAGREEADRQAQATAPKVAKLKADADAAAIAWAEIVAALRDMMETHTGFVGAATNGDKMAMRSVEYRDGDVLAALRSATRGRIDIDSLGAGPRDTLLVPPSESGE